MSVQTLLVPFASGRTNGENGGVKIDVPATSVDPGEVVPIYLWGSSADALEGYSLAQGADSLGSGTVRQYPGQTEARLFDLDGSGGLKAFTWPVLRLLNVAAIGPCFVADGNDVSVVALPGEDVTRHFRLSGNALVPAVDSAVGRKLCGTVRATAARSPWCREWSWTVPDEPLAGLPDTLCPATDEARDETLYWFFLLRWGVLAEEFSLSLSIVEIITLDYGEVWAQLSWNTLDDLDLWVVDPCGNRVWYSSLSQTCQGKTGTLDIDANAGLSSNVTETPVERIAWEDPPHGMYTVIVSFWAATEKDKTVDFTLLIQTGSGIVSLQDAITITTGRNDDYKVMYAFEYWGTK